MALTDNYFCLLAFRILAELDLHIYWNRHKVALYICNRVSYVSYLPYSTHTNTKLVLKFEKMQEQVTDKG